MLQNFRLGHATNSSSAHSIIFSRNTPSVDYIGGDPNTDSNYAINDARQKAIYGLYDIIEDMNAHERLQALQALQKHGLANLLTAEGQEQMDPDFDLLESLHRPYSIPMDTWLSFVLSPDVWVLCDTNEYSPAWVKDLRSGKGIELDAGDLLLREDKGAIIGYRLMSGTKFRWSPTPYTKSTVPELVDLKITDFCGYGCAFCYQGSTKSGGHAPFERIEAIIQRLAKMGVFEIAIGGGEPVHHPDFPRIMQAAAKAGIAANFTCYGTDWIKNAAILDALRAFQSNGIGIGVGVSIHSQKDIVKVRRIWETLKHNRLWNVSVMAQTVVGGTPPSVVSSILSECQKQKVPLLLLGYKTNGRGADFVPNGMDDATVKDLLKRAKDIALHSEGFTLSVDTAFIDRYGKILDALDVPTQLRTSPEGKFSMYIDAVTDTCAPSSYCGPEKFEPLGDIRAQFAQW